MLLWCVCSHCSINALNTIQVCPISKVPFAPEGGAIPRLLTCGHTIAHDALEQEYSSQVASGEASDGRIRCPVCNLSIPISSLGVSSIRMNSHVLDVIRRRETTRIQQDRIKKEAQHDAAHRCILPLCNQLRSFLTALLNMDASPRMRCLSPWSL